MNYKLFSRPIVERLSIMKCINDLSLSYKNLISINLALSNACGADCMFCPDTKNKRGVMSLQIVKKIANEISSNKFKSIHNVKRISVGENGDALLNPEFIEILRYLKKTNPDVSISINTNFQYFTKDISKIIVGERLIDGIMVNIDGHDDDSYYRMKRIPYSVVEQNILDFLEVRGNVRIPLIIICLPFAYYYEKIFSTFGVISCKVGNIDDLMVEDDFWLVKQKWNGRINKRIDKVVRSSTFGWAERESIKTLKFNHSMFKCSQMKRILHECFIAPNGDWYACCFDEKQRLVFGNINDDSINNIYHGVVRSDFIKRLKNRDYDSIGYPCNIVESCQTL